MQTILKKTIKDKVILDREHQKIVTELDGTIDRLEKELEEVKNIDKNHQRINGLLRKDLDKLKKENETLKKDQIEQNFFVVSIFTEKKAGVKLKKL